MNSLRRHIMMQQGGGGGPVLPPEYQQVAWIGADGSGQYILLNTIPYGTDRNFECICSIKTVPPCELAVFGCDANWNSWGYALKFSNIQSFNVGIIFHCRPNVTSSLVQTHYYPDNNEFVEYKLENGNCYINNVLYLTDNFTGYTNYPISIFALYRGGNIYTVTTEVRISRLRFYFDSDVANLIPCYRKSDNEPGMYDVINDVFYTNAGAGTFIVGNDV